MCQGEDNIAVLDSVSTRDVYNHEGITRCGGKNVEIDVQTHLIRTLHLPSKDTAIGCVNTQVLANKL